MLQVARLAPKSLGDATELVAHFLRSQFNPDGGAKDRAGSSDLYYTVFALEGLLALSPSFPSPGTPGEGQGGGLPRAPNSTSSPTTDDGQRTKDN